MSDKIKETEIDEETEQGLLRTYENDILGGLLAAAKFTEDESEMQPIQIKRNGVVFFEFRIRPLTEDEIDKCRKRHTKFVRNKQMGGVKVPESTDTTALHSDIIYTATVAEDRAKLWDNKKAWEALDVMSGRELIGKVLKPGEKDAIIDKIDEISGYSSLEELAKN